VCRTDEQSAPGERPEWSEVREWSHRAAEGAVCRISRNARSPDRWRRWSRYEAAEAWGEERCGPAVRDRSGTEAERTRVAEWRPGDGCRLRASYHGRGRSALACSPNERSE